MRYVIMIFVLLLLLIFGLVVTCEPDKPVEKFNFKLIVVVVTEGCQKDTLTCTYTSERKILPILTDDEKLTIGNNNWHKTMANHVRYYKILSNEIFDL